jgi:hypothetical protein
MNCLSKDDCCPPTKTNDYYYQYLFYQTGVDLRGVDLFDPAGVACTAQNNVLEEDTGLKSFAKKIGLHGVARWKPMGVEMAGLNSGETIVPGYTSEGSIGFEMGSERVRVGSDFYGRAAVNGQNQFAMSGGERFSASLDKYYAAFLAGFRTDGNLNPDNILPDSSTRLSLEGGLELGHHSDGLIPSFTAGALWNAADQKLTSTYVMLGYDW